MDLPPKIVSILVFGHNMRFWLSTVGANALGALMAFATTVLVAWFFGLEVFGDYAADLAKTSVLLVVLELVPSSFSLFRQQTDDVFARAYPAFYGAAMIVLPILGLLLILSGIINQPTWWMLPFIGLTVVQRYLDCQLQARGLLTSFVRLTSLANLFRLAVLLIAYFWNPGGSAADWLWGSLAIGLFTSLLICSRTQWHLLKQLLFVTDRPSWYVLWHYRHDFKMYYVNSILKRAKDNLLPLACDAILPAATSGLVLISYRAVDAVLGQIRLLEAVFTNLAVRARLQNSRKVIALIAAFAGQVLSITAAFILLFKQGSGLEVLGPAILASAIIYPYVAEIISRSDALVAHHPARVTLSLVVYLMVFATCLTVGGVLFGKSPYVFIASALAAQIGSALSYRLRRFPSIN